MYYNCKKTGPTYTVSFSNAAATGATVNSSAVSCTIPTVYNGATPATSCNVALPTTGYSYSGWTFNGWGTSSSSTSGNTGTIAISSTHTRYATWKKSAITITYSYNCNGGTGSPSNTTCTIPAVYNGATQNSYCTMTLPSSGCSYSGWTFNGWGTGTGSTSGTAAGGTVNVSTNATRYATWKKTGPTYTVSFSNAAATGATVTSSAVSCTIPTVYNGASLATSCSVTLPSSGYSYSGWTFNGWGTSSSSTSGANAGASISISANSTRYATWRKTKTRTVTYSCNSGAGASGTVSNSTCTRYAYNGSSSYSDCKVTLKDNGCTNSGWDFVGWGPSCSAKLGLQPGTENTGPDDSSFCAVWKKTITLKASYSCVVNGATSGATGSTNPTTCTYMAYNGITSGECDVTLASPNCSAGQQGWTFNGWSTSATHSGWSAGTVLTITQNQTYYATWKSSVTRTMSYNCNGGSGSTASTSCTDTAYNFANHTGCSINLATNSCGALSGHTWYAWGTASTSTSGSSAGTSVTLTSNATRYAVWRKSKTNTLTYNCNGGSSAPEASTCTAYAYNGGSFGTCSVNLKSGCSYSGWTFNNWSTNSSATSGTSPGTVISLSGNSTYYALWKKTATRTMSYNCNGGSGSTSSTSCTDTAYNGGSFPGCSVSLATNGCSAPSGYSWYAWGTGNTSTSGSSAGTSVTLTSNATRYAVWRKSTTYTLTYNCNGGSGAPSASTCTAYAYNGGSFGTCSVNLKSGCSYSGWTFNNWSTNSSATSGTSPGTVISLSGDTTYNALWKKVVTVTFNANGCTTTAGTVTGTLYNGATSLTVNTPSHTMQTNWTDTTGSSKTFTIGETATTASTNYTCSKTVTVTFAANSCATSSKTATMTLYNGGTSGSVTVPSVGATTSWSITGASASSSTISGATSIGSSMSITGIASSTTSVTRYYNCSKAPVITFSSNGCTTADGTVNSLTFWNGETTKNVTVPSHTMKTSWTDTTGSTKSVTVGLTASTATTTFTCSKTADIQFNAGGCTTADAATTATLTNGATSVTVSVPSHTMKTSWTDTTGSTKSVTVAATSTVGTTNFTCSKSVTITANANNCTTGAKSTTKTIINGAVTASVAKADFGYTMNSGWTDTTSYPKSVSVGATSTTGSFNVTCSKVLYATFNKGANVSSIGASTANCTIYNGSTSGCSVTFPSITPNTGYTSVGWGNYTGASSGTAPGSVTITSDVTKYANATDQTPPTCGTKSNEGSSSSWRNTTQTITVACTESGGSGCSLATFSKDFSNNTTGTITISDNAGNTRNCTVNAYVDTTTPTCGTASGASTSWITSGTRTITQACTAGVSGCASVSNTWSTDAKTGTITVTSGAGKTKSCTVNVYRDASKPTISCTGISGGTSGVSLTVSASDGVSGLATDPSGSKSGVKTTTTYTAKNGAGLTNTCTVTVTTSQVCPSGYPTNWSTTQCRKNTSSGSACSSGYTYNSSAGNCQKTTTTSHSGSSPSCGQGCNSPVVSGCSGGSSGVTCNWTCTCTVTKSASCSSGYGRVGGYCYQLANKVTSYSGS